MGRSSLEWLCLFIAVVRRGSSLAVQLHISHAKDIFLAPVYDRFPDGFCECGPREPARLAAAASSVALICWRPPCARSSPWALPVRLQTSGGSIAALVFERSPRRVRVVDESAPFESCLMHTGERVGVRFTETRAPGA